MKKLLIISVFFICADIHSQNWTETMAITPGLGVREFANGLDTYAGQTGNPNEWSKIMGVFYEFDDIRFKKLGLEGSAYLFKNWDNKGVVQVDKKRYVFTNMNYHIYKGQFMSKLENDSIFILNSTTVDKILINNKLFRGIHDSNKGTTKMYEVVYENKDFSILKDYQLSFIESSPNPMVNRPKPKIKKNSNYFTYRNKTMMPIRLKKAAVLDLAGGKAIEAAAFAKTNKLSYKKEQDIRKILRYVNL